MITYKIQCKTVESIDSSKQTAICRTPNRFFQMQIPKNSSTSLRICWLKESGYWANYIYKPYGIDFNILRVFMWFSAKYANFSKRNVILSNMFCSYSHTFATF